MAGRAGVGPRCRRCSAQRPGGCPARLIQPVCPSPGLALGQGSPCLRLREPGGVGVFINSLMCSLTYLYGLSGLRMNLLFRSGFAGATVQPRTATLPCPLTHLRLGHSIFQQFLSKNLSPQ